LITIAKKYTMTCEACGNIVTSTNSKSIHTFAKWARHLGWEVCMDGKTHCPFHRTRRAPIPDAGLSGPVQLDLFDPEPAGKAEEVKKW
jgi:hypothetical protein